MNRPVLGGWLFLIALAAGCGQAESPRPQRAYAPPGKATATPAEAGAGYYDAPAAEAPAGGAAGEPLPGDLASARATGLKRMIIYDAEVELAVEKFSDVAAQIGGLAERFGGFVASSSVSGMPGDSRQGLWRMRVPSARFQALLDAIRPLGEIRSLSTSSSDVSEEFYDIEARVRNQKQEEARLLKLLDERTGKLEEVLAVEREIARVRGEIERLEGRLRVLTDLTSLSTVTLRVSEISVYHPAEEAAFATRLGRSFHSSLASLVAFAEAIALFIAASLPWLTVLGLALAAALTVRRQVVRRRA
ncbi:MAG TPA: DUF4349 domain-containing protein [Pirellulales bacterium]|nr:DUF4349 domain-containing protein [Pirellulales bacterium]